jgi:YD repeat-containing protein
MNTAIPYTISQVLGTVTFPLKLYNENGKLVYNETSSGRWIKYTYDFEGNPLSYENSDGTSRIFKSGPPSRVREIKIDGIRYSLTKI